MFMCYKIPANNSATAVCLFCLLLVLPGCDILSSSSDSNTLIIQTTKELYNLNEDDFFEVSVKNISVPEVYYTSCSSQRIEIYDSTGTTLFETIWMGGITYCYCLCPVVFKSGNKPSEESVTVPMFNVSRLSNSKEHGHLFNESLSYRIVFQFYLDKEMKEEAPPEMSRTNEFRLTGFD